MNEQTKVTKAKVIFARTCIVLTGLVLATGGVLAWMNARSAAPAARQDPYDYETSIAKLKKIGQALQIYRAEYGFKPVAERKTYSDAGLPPSILVLAKAGRIWSLPEGIATFTLPDARYDQGNPISFSSLYWGPEGNSEMFDLSAAYAERGERMPILADFHPAMVAGRGAEVVPAILLRLDGTVEITQYNRKVPHDVYAR